MAGIATQLVDLRNYDQFASQIKFKLSVCTAAGFDIETHDDDAHPGIKEYRKKDTARVFDVNRTTLCGLSIYVDDDDTAYYLNIGHADTKNRLDWFRHVKPILDAKNPNAIWLVHNGPFELTMLKKTVDYDLHPVVCTMQLLVSAYGPDEYNLDVYMGNGLGHISSLFGDVRAQFFNYKEGEEMTEQQQQLLSKVIAKESDAAHSYNGLVAESAYGYSLKKAVWSWFGVRMTTYNEVLAVNSAKHMGELTGEQVAEYGAEDAFWAVALYSRIIEYILKSNPAVLDTYFHQELPMIHVYAGVWSNGLRVNQDGIRKAKASERVRFAEALRKLKDLSRRLLPFDPEPQPRLYELEPWYRKNWRRYRGLVEHWASLPNDGGAYTQSLQVSGSIPKSWAQANEDPIKLTGPNFTHYMMTRTMIYDLLRERPMRSEGKVQSDGEGRGRLIDRIAKRTIDEDPHAKTKIEIIKLIGEVASAEQSMKLYLNPYSKLVDPSTGRMYPTITSMLASRRMAGSNPNPMQLAKRGPLVYIRGIYQADRDDHLVVSIDWSQIELVLIGELSGDREFARAYGQLPYDDLHIVAIAELLGVSIETLKELKSLPDDYPENTFKGISLFDHKGNRLTPSENYKYQRGNEGGKGANFNYWYSGALSTIAQVRGWSTDQMWEMTERYRNKFWKAEEWRQNTILKGRELGYVMLPDNHRRVKFEATMMWAGMFMSWWSNLGHPGTSVFGRIVTKKIHNRAANQLVNSLIQGTCATLAKRSIIRINEHIANDKFDARFLMPIHDELVYSVHHSQVMDFIRMAKGVMLNHPDIISNLRMNASASVGVTFEPWHETKAPYGQIELDEAPKLKFLDPKLEGKALDDKSIKSVIDYLSTGGIVHDAAA